MPCTSPSPTSSRHMRATSRTRRWLVRHLWRLPYSAALLSQRQSLRVLGTRLTITHACMARWCSLCRDAGVGAAPGGAQRRTCQQQLLCRPPAECNYADYCCSWQAEGKPVNHQLAKELLAGLVRLSAGLWLCHVQVRQSDLCSLAVGRHTATDRLTKRTLLPGWRRGGQALRDQVRTPQPCVRLYSSVSCSG